MGMLFCVGKDGNRAAGKMLNRRVVMKRREATRRACGALTRCARRRSRRFDIARHVAALLAASFKAPDRRYLGVKWCVFLYRNK